MGLRNEADGEYQVEFSTSPTREACAVDRRLYDEHYETWLHGVRAIIHDQPGRPWFNPALAKDYESRFKTGWQMAKIRDMTGGQRGAIRQQYKKVL
jgi:hypothetical protein